MVENDKKIRLLLTRHHLDGHERGYNVVATGLREAGIEVILGGPLLVDQIARTAIQEDVDFIGYRIMSAEPTTLVSLLIDKLRQEDHSDIPIIVGGIIQEKDVNRLKEKGVAEVFRPGSSIESIVDFIRGYQQKRQETETS